MPILDRIPSKPDPIRQTTFSMAPLVQGLAPRSYTWRVPFVLDQGSEGACVAHGITHEAIARPVVVDFAQHRLPTWATRAADVTADYYTSPSEKVAQAFAFDLYDWCRRNDEWAGENYDGTSAAAGAKGAAEAGIWGEYRWTRNVYEFAVWVSRQGPGCIAVDWHQEMMEPDRNGYLWNRGPVVGGHMILVNGYNVKRKAFRLTNSWGTSWGQDGAAWLHEEVLARLVASNGELLAPVRRLS